jgi:excisionase family DNA binding protein
LSVPSQLDALREREPHQRLVPIREAAVFLSVSVSTLYGWVWQRRIPFVKIGRALRFDLWDLEAFINAIRALASQCDTHTQISRANVPQLKNSTVLVTIW